MGFIQLIRYLEYTTLLLHVHIDVEPLFCFYPC